MYKSGNFRKLFARNKTLLCAWKSCRYIIRIALFWDNFPTLAPRSLDKVVTELNVILTDWSVVLDNNVSNDAFNKLVDIIMALCDNYIPVKSPSKSSCKKVCRSPWIFKSILRSINRKNSIFLQI